MVHDHSPAASAIDMGGQGSCGPHMPDMVRFPHHFLPLEPLPVHLRTGAQWHGEEQRVGADEIVEEVGTLAHLRLHGVQRRLNQHTRP